jgi:hypothetical protein
MPLDQSAVGWERLCVPGRSPEPVVSAELIAAAIGDQPEPFRALLPVGYEAGVAAYRQAANSLMVSDLSQHYTDGLHYFHERFVPYLKEVLTELAGGAWDLSRFVGYAAGSDVDFMTHLVSAVAAEGDVKLFPGDWFGFRVGVASPDRITWDDQNPGDLACLCVPSVRNGHLTPEMAGFLARSKACLLNINLFPTLHPIERRQIATSLAPVLDKSIISISFSRGFGLTGSQLGVVLIHRDHPLRQRYELQWNWLTYFFNGIAARAFMALDLQELDRTDELRRDWVIDWATSHGFPVVETGSYYVKSFRVREALPPQIECLRRNDLVRLCFKPPIVGTSR